MEWKKGTPLAEDQTTQPVVWHQQLGIDFKRLPRSWFEAFWGDDKETKRIRVFGHQDPKDKTSPHFLCTRGGTPMHVDPGYTRWALQIQLHNDGFGIHGLDGLESAPLCRPGLAIILDTWSPHQVSRDKRLHNTGVNKLLIGMDFKDKPDPDKHLPALIAHIPTLWSQRW